MTYSTVQEETIEFLQRLVRCPSYSGEEKLTADVVEAQMRRMDFDKVWQDDYGNVIGMRAGSRPGPSILFDGHMDVVSIGSEKEWTHAPFGAELSGSKIWGRGASDTKASLAGMVMSVGSLPREQFSGTLYVVGSVGEEIIEGSGLLPVLEAVRPHGVVIGEPTDCRLGIGHKGRARIVFSALGRSAHSSTPENGENPLLKAAEILKRIETLPLPQDRWLGKGVTAPIQIISKPFPSTSIIPFECQITYDRRLIQNESPESILAEYYQALADLPGWVVSLDDAEYTTYTGRTITLPDFHAGWVMPPASAWVRAALNGLSTAGLKSETYTAPYCTNGSASAGDCRLPSLIYGPSSILLAHIVDEYIQVDELLRGLAGFDALAKALTALTEQEIQTPPSYPSL